MTGILALIIRILSNPYSNVIQKRLCSKGLCALWVSFFAYFILSVLCIFPALTINWADFSTKLWLYASLGGFAGALGNWFLVEAIKCGELSVLGPVNSYKSVISVIFAYFLLGEIPSGAQFLGILFIIFGSYFVFDTTGEKFTLRLLLRHDIKYRFLALALTALEAVFIKKIILLSGVLPSFIIWCIFSAVFSFVFLYFCNTNIKADFKISLSAHLKTFLALCGCMFLMQFSTNIVFEKMSVPCALALFQLSSLVSVILGRKYFSEGQIKKKIAGTIVMIFGSIVVILF